MHLPALDQFFAQYRVIAAQLDTDPRDDLHRYDTFLRGLSAQLQDMRQLEAGNAPRFNIFNIIRMESYEALTHTPFLAHLLDPRGSHAQGDLFYNLFLDQLPTPRKDQFRTSSLQISPEHWTADGFIDIYIRSRDPRKPFCMVLENKINAGDQPDQMSRYYQYALKQMGRQERILLIYLTKSGNQPSAGSMSLKDQEHLRGIDCLHAISYREFISRFLLASLPKIQAPAVRHTVEQYIQLITSF